MAPVTAAPDVSALSYEQARDELVEVVAKLESGAASLEESLALWERGEALADRCQTWLDSARDRLVAAQVSGDTADPDDAGDAAEGPAAQTAGAGARSGGAPDQTEEAQR
ncbi:exodeoxyribonuclease VII small subunit [Ruania halotolerans]|uniref:exodeoxyribonuclease VII small subunit n=1 Tax=Ruania halotolerans TaxID=2897773 RepID=UPI001E3D95F8|nr:exodeoxyribonuclease VII small subunit [Ruania halotolerans]UFU07456.1 exodeoxyribonuclease VII small subunit [Ruania halotolerans]